MLLPILSPSARSDAAIRFLLPLESETLCQLERIAHTLPTTECTQQSKQLVNNDGVGPVTLIHALTIRGGTQQPEPLENNDG
jgi:hypothetical protein